MKVHSFELYFTSDTLLYADAPATGAQNMHAKKGTNLP